MKYQRDYSKHFLAVRDEETRKRKATKIIRILKDFLMDEDLSDLKCLDMGCSIGVISKQLAWITKETIGIDIDTEAIEYASRNSPHNCRFLVSDVGQTPFLDKTFDIIVCSQVYEHTPSIEMLISEIHRLLKDKGVCFFSGPNRWAIMEEHYNLPLLSWFPRQWADKYVQLTGKADEYYEKPRSEQELRQLLNEFNIYDYTPHLIQTPDYFMMGDEVGIFQKIPNWGWKLINKWIPNFNWILTK